MELSVQAMAGQLAEAIDQVANAGERVILRRQRKPVAAIVSIKDLAALEKLEDEADAKAARKALAEMKRKSQKPIPLAEVKTRLGMK
jgi:PHD/YefM family antitoxin component YafN of YafNO toxin-antitoxin module